jgi:BirA family biotin operon repressor/biotin-[acetyl-CoA-carboxylase] ligase
LRQPTCGKMVTDVGSPLMMHENPGLDLQRLAALRSGVIGSRISYEQELGSTMDEARSMAESGAPEGLVVIAERQTKGRGRFERTWVSTPGLDLTFSVLLRLDADQLRMANMAATMAVQDAALALTDKAAVIKWPNDVLVSGRKLSGILVESVMTATGNLDFAVIGVGLNVNLRPAEHPEIRDIATSLAQESGAPLDRTAVLIDVLARLDDYYGAIRAGKDLSVCWAGRLDTVGRDVDVSWGGRTVSGRATGVDRDGNLLVEAGGEVTTVVAGEVTLRPGPGDR